MLLFLLGFVATVFAQCTTKDGYDVVGSNLAQTNVNSLQECCALCQRMSECKAAAFWNNICYPKAGDQVVPKAGVTAIIKTPPPAQCSMKDGYDVVGSNIAQTNVNSLQECCALCQRMPECQAAAFWNNICYPKAGNQIVPKAGVTAIIKGQLPPVPPTQPPRPGGPLATFLVIGDWGYDNNVHGNAKPACQGIIGAAMQAVNNQYKVDFVINVGDSFYPNGIASRNDGKWQSMWKKFYGDLVNVPWFSVYGNHDYEGADRCACYDDLSKCAQINPGQSGWFMPGYSYFDTRYLASLKTEIVALDTNTLVAEDTCKYANCGGQTCQNNLAKRAADAVNLLEQRIAQSTAKNLLVFSHYPTDYFRRMPRVLDALKTPKYHVEFFGGHRHNVDQRSTIPISPGNTWLVGGGGGWGCDGTEQGFLIGFVNPDYTITTKSQIVDYRSCCN